MRFKEIQLDTRDDDLIGFETDGAAPLPDADEQGYIENAGARIWYATYGFGPPVILLHGGLGHSGNWGYQVPALVKHGYRVVVMDSRGHGHSTRDARPFTYELMASDVSAVHGNYSGRCRSQNVAMSFRGSARNPARFTQHTPVSVSRISLGICES